jgi:ribosomal peptide maturation radical SAM protein 1
MLVTLTPQTQDELPDGAGRILDERPFRVALVCMPFARAKLPSIQIGLITAISQEAGFETDAYHFNLDLAAQVSPDLYEQMCDHRGNLTGEWLFSKAAFGTSSPAEGDDFFASFPSESAWAKKIGKDQAFLSDLRDRVLPSFIDTCLARADWSRYGVVGFSSTFQQNVACLALASRIKERFPAVKIVFGGANMEAEMGPECGRAFPFIDHVVSGEGDVVFPALLRALRSKQPVTRLAGVTARTGDGLQQSEGQAPPVTDLNVSPVPNYVPYFDRAIELGLLPHYKTEWALPVESSRGCWWGSKHHCTFCGLNGLGMSFRAKRPERFLDELTELTRRHSISAFEAVDNILDLKYLPAVFAKIEQSRTDYRFFYEVKANLTRAQIQSLYRGGIRCVQPGIESMSTHILQLMRKGCTMLQNVLCLKWCLYYNIRVGWNLLSGFPGETDEDYQEQLAVLKCITHLEPPTSCSRIWLERFSPYYHDRERFPVSNIRPQASYRYVYPPHVDLEKIAYFFDYEMENTIPDSAHESTQALVSEWQQDWNSARRHTLSYRRTSDGLLVDYNWGPEKSGTYSFSGALASIYEFCVETMHRPKEVVEHLRQPPRNYSFSEEQVRDAMDEYCRGRLMIREDDRYFSLAIPSNPNW